MVGKRVEVVTRSGRRGALCTVIDVAPRLIEKQGSTHIPVKYVTRRTLRSPAAERDLTRLMWTLAVPF